MKLLPPANEMQKAIRRKDRDYDGVFFTAVKTTGIFCRPSCPARTARPANVEFFGTARQAIFAGYRPCRRCRPLDVNGRPPEWVRRLLDLVEASRARRIRDQDVRSMRIDPARARRFFLKEYGMTFQAYARGRRLGEALSQIRRGAPVTDVAIGHGYSSGSGFREAFGKTFGRAPKEGREADCIVCAMMESPVGSLLLGATEEGVCLVEFGDRRAIEAQVRDLRRRMECAVVPGMNRHLVALRRQLEEYFAGKRKRFDLPLVYPGTAFQRRVWECLLTIPYGETWSYEELAKAAGRPGAQRAAGSANGKNRIAIVIPCHRVVNKGGKIGGYGGGIWRKEILLALERGEPSLLQQAR